MKKKVPVAELQFGMYVYELDRPWSESPFAFQGFVLKTQQQLDGLRKYCKHVFIDTLGGPAARISDLRPGSGPVAADLPGTGKVVHVERVSVESEFAHATESYASAMQVVKGAFDAIRDDKALDLGELKVAVGNMTESMLRNPDAMVLLSALQERGGYHLGRALNVSIYMMVFARFLGMDVDAIERAGLVGLLQDVGMLKIPQSVREKEGRLSPEELALVQTHVARTKEQLRSMPGLPSKIAKIAGLHHERHDGSGYPRGKKGDSIGVLGAIAGIVDVFDALTTKRRYAEAMSPSNALAHLNKQRDKAFHPVLVDQFVRCIGFFPVGSVVELNSGETGIVISQSQAKRLLPRVMVLRDDQGQLLRPQKLLDLAKMPKIGGGESYRIRRTLEYGSAGVTAKEIMLA